MRTSHAFAPKLLDKLLSIGVSSFTVLDAARLLETTEARAKATIIYGEQIEKVRVARKEDRPAGRRQLYEVASWRTQWITKPWR